MSVLFYLSLVFFIFLCGILCLTILVQESKSLGLGASFGGDPGESLFGTSTADVLKKTTAWIAAIFMIACILLSIWSASIGNQRSKALPTTIEEVEQ